MHEDKLIAVSSVADFSPIREGGCFLPCNHTLKHGNSCPKQCHVSGQQSDLHQCKQHEQREPSCQPCKRGVEPEDRILSCGQKVEPAGSQVPDVML